MSNLPKKSHRHSNLAHTLPREAGQDDPLVNEKLKKLSEKLNTRTATKTKRILCIDGGGIKGVLPISFLATLQKKIDEPIRNYFDLIVGTSTGGIIALGLGLSVSPSEILDMYIKHADNIFGKIAKKNLSGVFSLSKYKREGLEKALKEIIGEKKLGNSRTRLVIPTWDNDLKNPYLYKTAHHSRYRFDHEKSAIEIALATSAAPYYFEEYVNSQAQAFCDGGLFAINPIMIAVTEAVGILNWDRHNLKIMSLGTTSEKRILENVNIYKINEYIIKIINNFLDSQQKSALLMAGFFVNKEDENNIFRIDEEFSEGQFKIDDPKSVKRLEGLGEKLARENFNNLHKIFFAKPTQPFKPIYLTGV